MSDVLKQVAEALVNLHTFAAPHNRLTDEPWAWMERDYTAALTALRGLEWMPVEAMDEGDDPPEVTLGKWYGDTWLIRSDVSSKLFAVKYGWTHFCRPILPAPPKREGQ